MSSGPQVAGSGTYDTQSQIPQYQLNTNAPQQTGQQLGVQGYNYNTQGPQQTTQGIGAPAFAEQRAQYTQAMWDQMQPEHQRQEDKTRTMLMNQGLTQGSEAYNTELERLGSQQAGERWNAIQAGGQEQQRMNQLMMQQQQQAYGQDMGSRQFGNQALGQQFGQGLQQGQFTNQALQNQFGMGLQGQQAQNQALMQQFGQGQQAGQFYNQAGQQAYGQELGANQQNFQQQLQQANYQNQLRQQAIAEQAQARGMSLNEMNAMLNGQQVQTPQMPSFMGASAGQAPNLLGAAQAQGQYGMQQYQADQQANAGLWGGIGQLAGAAGTAAMLFSDVRLKSSIVKVGEHPIGVNIYEYDIFGHRERGVIAQELLTVAPELVAVHPSGFLTVDYRGL
jgi:hypothetical protein